MSEVKDYCALITFLPRVFWQICHVTCRYYTFYLFSLHFLHTLILLFSTSTVFKPSWTFPQDFIAIHIFSCIFVFANHLLVVFPQHSTLSNSLFCWFTRQNSYVLSSIFVLYRHTLQLNCRCKIGCSQASQKCFCRLPILVRKCCKPSQVPSQGIPANMLSAKVSRTISVL